MLISGKTQKVGMTIIYFFALNRRQISPTLSLYLLGYKTGKKTTPNQKTKSKKKKKTVYLERAS